MEYVKDLIRADIAKKNNLHTVVDALQKPTKTYALEPLDVYVNKIHDNQKEIVAWHKKEHATGLAAVMRDISDFVSPLFGESEKTDIFTLFEQQQEVLRGLNCATAQLVLYFNDHLVVAQHDLDELLGKAKKDFSIYKQTEKQFQPQKAIILPDQDEPSFYDKFSEFVQQDREQSKQSHLLTLQKSVVTYHNQDLETTLLREKIFRAILANVTQIAQATQLYQNTLERNIPMWKATAQLSGAATALKEGVDILGKTHQYLVSNYCESAKGIQKIAGEYPHVELISGDNAQMRNLAQTLDYVQVVEENE